jgi:hypothetical protein
VHGLVSERTTELGCWILVDHPLGRIEQAAVFWYLDVYPTRPEAEKAGGPRGTIIESLGKIWLLTIEKAGWRPSVQGERIAEIGPLPVSVGKQYSALFMESISTPGNDFSHTYALWTRSLVYPGWRNMFGDSRRQTGWTSGGLASHCAGRAAHATYRYRRRSAPRADPDTPRFL